MSLEESFYFIPYLVSLIVVLSLYLSTVIYIWIKYYISIRKLEEGEKKDILPLVYGFIFLLFFIGRIFSFLFDYTTELNPANYNPENMIFWKIGVSFQVFAFAIFFILIEIRVMKGRDKYILLILFFIFYLIGMITSNITFVVIAIVFSLYIPFAYLYIAKLSSGIVRRKAFFVFIGFLLFFISAILMASLIITMTGLEPLLMHLISNLVKVVAIIFLFLGLKK